MNEKIQQFVESERIAVVGVSSSKMKFGSVAFRELKKKGYTVYPVNPSMELYGGGKCFSRLSDIDGGVDAALVSVKPAKAEAVVDDAIAVGIGKLWFQTGADFSLAIKKAEDSGIATVSGKCLLMYAPPVTGIHGFHRWLAKLFGKY